LGEGTPEGRKKDRKKGEERPLEDRLGSVRCLKGRNHKVQDVGRWKGNTGEKLAGHQTLSEARNREK